MIIKLKKKIKSYSIFLCVIILEIYTKSVNAFGYLVPDWMFNIIRNVD